MGRAGLKPWARKGLSCLVEWCKLKNIFWWEGPHETAPESFDLQNLGKCPTSTL